PTTKSSPSTNPPSVSRSVKLVGSGGNGGNGGTPGGAADSGVDGGQATGTPVRPDNPFWQRHGCLLTSDSSSPTGVEFRRRHGVRICPLVAASSPGACQVNCVGGSGRLLWVDVTNKASPAP